MKISFHLHRLSSMSVFLALTFLTALGCSHNPVLSTGKMDPDDLGKNPILRKVEFKGGLAKKIKIAEVKQSRVTENLLTIQVGLQNLTDKELNLNYKVEWLDGDGMIVKDSSLVWKPLLIRGGDTVGIQSVATTPNARNFNLKIQKAKNS